MTEEKAQKIADTLLKPILNIIDEALLADENLVDDCNASLESMGKNLSTAQAMSGILLKMAAVDKQALLHETFKAFCKLVIHRKNQREITTKIAIRELKNECASRDLHKALGL